MFIPEGQGKIDVLFDASAANTLEALLYNFDFDDFYGYKFRPLKKEHSQFLEERVVPLLADGKGDIWLQGSASRIGSDDWNKVLSQTRESTVQAFLLDHGVSANQIQVQAVGSTLTKNHALDDPRDRGVLLWVYPKFEFPIPPIKVPHRPKISNVFKIAVDGDFPPRWKRWNANIPEWQKAIQWGTDQVASKLKMPISHMALPFIVWDVTNHLACRYVYIDFEIGFDAGVDLGLPQPHGPWNIFTTDKAIGCNQFGKGARLTTISLLGGDQTQIHIDTPSGVSDVYTNIVLGMGPTWLHQSTPVPYMAEFDLMTRPEVYGGP
jgi:hypothetical protein